MNEWRNDWIIGICNSAENGVKVHRFRGSIQEAKEKLLELVNKDRAENSDTWEYGTEDAESVDAVDGLGYELYAYGNYIDHHMEYTAKEYAHVESI